MCTANKLEGSLSGLKRRLGLTFIKFEDAAVELEPFVRAHVFDTASYLGRQMLQHFKDVRRSFNEHLKKVSWWTNELVTPCFHELYKLISQELKWQAAKILGSVDFLGNPLGFVADVSEGVTGLLLEGNVRALLKNVTHGISNSAAKVSGKLLLYLEFLWICVCACVSAFLSASIFQSTLNIKWLCIFLFTFINHTTNFCHRSGRLISTDDRVMRCSGKYIRVLAKYNFLNLRMVWSGRDVSAHTGLTKLLRWSWARTPDKQSVNCFEVMF